MKALTLTQPWASLVATGAKRIETRSWTTSYRGVIAIHAAKGFPNDCRELCASQPFLRELTRAGLSMPELPRGAIVALARLTSVERTETIVRMVDGGVGGLLPHELDFGDYTPGRYAWLLDCVLPLKEPLPCVGALGLWTIPSDVEAALGRSHVT